MSRQSSFHFYTFGLLRRLYEWVLSWAHKKYSTAALFVLAFTESSFFPIPPDVLQLALSISRTAKAFFYALVSTIGSVLGGMFGYLIGLLLYDTVGATIISTLGYEDKFAQVQGLYATYAFAIVFISAFTPIPYKVFTIAAGVASISFPLFVLASFIGRGARFFLIAALIHFFGKKIKDFIDKYFNILTVGVSILIILGFVILHYVL